MGSLGSRTEHTGMGRRVTSPLGLGQAGITTQVCFLWSDQNHKEPAVLSNGPGRSEGRESPFIWIRAGRVRGGHGEMENLALIPGYILCVLWDRKEPENKTQLW